MYLYIKSIFTLNKFILGNLFTFSLQLTFTLNDGQLFQKDLNVQVQRTYNQLQNNIFLTFHVDVFLMFEDSYHI